MFTRTKIVVSIAAVVGTVFSASAMAQASPSRQAGLGIQRQIPTSVEANGRFSFPADQSSRATATYFDPDPAPFKAYTYAASVRLRPSTSERIWRGELSFPAFNATPNVSVQIISSIGAVPIQFKSLKMVENPGPSGPIETQIIVEAEPIFDGVPSGSYFANLVVTGVPVELPAKSHSAKLPNGA